MGDVLNRATALFLDFDGTLAPLQDNPDAVALPSGGADILMELAEALGGALALVSGRDARDLSRRVPRDLWRAGNHGDLIVPPGQDEPIDVPSPPDALLTEARALAEGHEGVWLEEKARVLALHTRSYPDAEERLIEKLEQLAAAVGGYKVQRGKHIIELKPEGVHKGAAIDRLMGQTAFKDRNPLFIGDDTTDEDGFLTAIHRGGSAIKVGEGKTLAPHRLADPDAVWTFLKEARNDLA